MRSIRFLAVATTVLVLGSACGGDDPPTGGGNVAPVASFTAPTNCVANAACNFTSTSTDDAAVTTWSWDFDGAGSAPNVTTSSASFTFTAQGTYPVTLTVGDAQGLTNAVAHDVIVAAAPVVNTPPTASFTVTPDCTEGTPCGFHSTSTDADGTIATSTWNFGDASAPGDGADVTHTYATAGTYTVSLTVTDNLGLASTAAPQQLVVAPAASQDCTTTGTTVACSLTMTQRVTVKLTIVSQDCELSGNDLSVTAPRGQTVFQNLCNRTPGQEYTVTAADNVTPLVFEAGTPLVLRLVQGDAGPGDPPTGDPGIQISGNYPNWTLNIDDGGAAGTLGEPDFNDTVISVQATVAP